MGLGMANLKCSRILVVAASTAPGSLALLHMRMCTTFGFGYFPLPSIFTPASFDQKVRRTERGTPTGDARLDNDVAASWLADVVPSRLVVPDHSLRCRIDAPGVGICPPWHL